MPKDDELQQPTDIASKDPLPDKQSLPQKEDKTTDDPKNAEEQGLLPTNPNAANDLLAPKSEKVPVQEQEEEEKKEIVFFWPEIQLSDEILSMANQTIKEKHDQIGSYDYKPYPPPDHIRRKVERKDLSDGRKYEGEVDEQGQPDGRGI